MEGGGGEGTEEEQSLNETVRSDSAKVLPTQDLPGEKQKPDAMQGQTCEQRLQMGPGSFSVRVCVCARVRAHTHTHTHTHIWWGGRGHVDIPTEVASTASTVGAEGTAHDLPEGHRFAMGHRQLAHVAPDAGTHVLSWTQPRVTRRGLWQSFPRFRRTSRAKVLRAPSSSCKELGGRVPKFPRAVDRSAGHRGPGGLPGLWFAGTLSASTTASVRCLQACEHSPDLRACSKATLPSANFFKN